MGTERKAGGAYHSGTDFLAAADRLEASMSAGGPEQLMLMAPAIVCRAFALELFFKSILALSATALNKHDLRVLFEQLDDQTKARVRAALALRYPGDVFDKQIAHIRGAFVDWRYSYERTTPHIKLDFMSALCQAVKAEADRHFGARRLLPIHSDGA